MYYFCPKTKTSGAKVFLSHNNSTNGLSRKKWQVHSIKTIIMKRIVPLFFLLIPQQSFGQDNYMSLSFGAAFPQSDFGSTENLSKDGFAEQGFTGEYTGLYLLTDYFGIGGNIKFSSNGLSNKLRSRLEDEIPDDLPLDSITITTNFGSWKQVALVVGPHFTLPLSRMNIDAYAMAGVNFVMPPEMEISAIIDDEWYLRSFSSNTVSYALDFGIALRYHLNEDYSLRLFSSYFMSKSKGKIREEINQAGNLEPTESDFSSNIRSFHVGIGIVYRL
jgi:hypothetical protein